MAAGERQRAAGAARDLHASMPAGVAEGADLPVGPAHRDQRHASRLASHERPASARAAEEQNGVRGAAQQALLGLQAQDW